MDGKKKILIVDDEEINLDFFDVMLSKLGFIVAKANNGEQALEEVKRFKPDLIMLDNIMPRLSGWEVTKILKHRDDYREYSEIPIIMFSAMDDVKDKVEGFELGIDDYITKPYNFSEVLARIRSLLRTRELIIQLEKRERRIALTEKLNDDVLSFADSLRAPIQTLLELANTNSPELAKAITKEGESFLARLGTLDDDIQRLKIEEETLKKAEIEIQALRTSHGRAQR